MADSKITALTSISTSTDPANDPLVIVDVSDTSMAATGTTKKVTLNQLLGASGTATLASATITGDLTVDTSTLKVDSANNRVGIGTASPALPFAVSNAGAQGFEINPNGSIVSGGIDILSYNRSTSLYKGIGFGAESYLFRVGTVSVSDAMTLNSTGLGVGTSPSAKLDVRQIAAAEGLKVYVNDTGATNIINFRSYDNTLGEVTRYAVACNGVATWSNVGGVAGTAMTLNSTGLGVGVSPQAKIHIANASMLIETLSTQNKPSLALGSLGAYYGLIQNDGTGLWSLAYGSSLTALGTPVLSWNSSGNVGIGITSPSYLLHTSVPTGGDRNMVRFQVSGASSGLTITWNNGTQKMRVNFGDLPTSSAGLPANTLWVDTAAGNTLKLA